MYRKIFSEKYVLRIIYNLAISLLYKILSPLNALIKLSNELKLVRTIKYYLAPLDKLVITKINDINFIVNFNDKVNSKKIYINREFPQFLLFSKAYKIANENNKVISSVVDIGAHYGNIVIPAVMNFNLSKGIAIEPIEENFNILNSNIILNNLHSKIDSHKNFISNEDSNVNLQTYKNNSAAALFQSNMKSTNINSYKSLNNLSELKNEQVESKKLDSFENINLLIDPIYWVYAQGQEFNIIYSGNNLFDKTPPLVIAYAPLLCDTTKISEKRFVEFLKSKKYNKVIDLYEDNIVHNDIVESYFLSLKKQLTKTSSVRLLMFI